MMENRGSRTSFKAQNMNFTMSNEKLRASIVLDEERNLSTNPSPQASQKSILKKGRDILYEDPSC